MCKHNAGIETTTCLLHTPSICLPRLARYDRHLPYFPLRSPKSDFSIASRNLTVETKRSDALFVSSVWTESKRRSHASSKRLHTCDLEAERLAAILLKPISAPSTFPPPPIHRTSRALEACRMPGNNENAALSAVHMQ
jgi:hypothetical protein